jgi:hypothetical protein
MSTVFANAGYFLLVFKLLLCKQEAIIIVLNRSIVSLCPTVFSQITKLDYWKMKSFLVKTCLSTYTLENSMNQFLNTTQVFISSLYITADGYGQNVFIR